MLRVRAAISLFLIASAFAQVEIQTVYQADCYPKFVEARERKELGRKGICVDMLELLQKEVEGLKISISSKSMSLPRILSSLERENLDVFLGLAHNAQRAEKFDYLYPPLYEVNYVITVRAGDSFDLRELKSLEDFRGRGVFLTNYQTNAAHFLARVEGLEIDSTGTEILQNMKKLLADRGRFYFFHDLSTRAVIKQFLNEKDFAVLPRSFYRYHHFLVCRKGLDPEIKHQLTEALRRLNESGKFALVRSRYNLSRTVSEKGP